ncbi:C40 family peptidase [Motilibacter peucedani]|uniref:C40 family peptidase n=1 Tax=Motilibacter peucedani TaxID=598650 RepID=UPI001E400670|nr:C40 family peptidase [Motilibacter peucedani]
MLHAVTGARTSVRRLALALSLSAAAVVVPLAGEAAATPAAPAAAVVAQAAPTVTPSAVTRTAAAHRSAAARHAAVVRRAAAVRAHKVAKLLKTAAALKGRPYVYGATGPRSFDCSGFTGWVMRHAGGTSLPRTSGQQYAASKKISKGSMKPGDLVFFRSGSHVYHVAIYAGHNRIWHARQPGQGVALTPISSHSWVAGRVI